jgi:hypothetical protein
MTYLYGFILGGEIGLLCGGIQPRSLPWLVSCLFDFRLTFVGLISSRIFLDMIHGEGDGFDG